jgi:hypothetical protein
VEGNLVPYSTLKEPVVTQPSNLKIHLKEPILPNRSNLKESVKFMENKAKLYWIIRGNLSKTSEEKLIEHLGEEWEAIQGRHDALDLWNAIVATHNAVSSGNNDMDIIKMRRHFEIIRQGPDETPLQYKERFKNALDAIQQLGVDISGENGDATFSPHNLALRYINNLDPARYSTVLVDLENDVAKGTDCYPTTLVDAFNLAMKWKTVKPKSMEGAKPLAVYAAHNQKGRRIGKGGIGRNGIGGGENGGGGIGGGENAQGQIGQPGNFSQDFRGKCYICNGVGHRKHDCPHVANVRDKMKNARDENANQVAVAKRNRVGFEDTGLRATFVIRNVTLNDAEKEAHLLAGGALEGEKVRLRRFDMGTSSSIYELYTSVHSAIKYGLEWKDTYVVMDTAAESSLFNNPMLLDTLARRPEISKYQGIGFGVLEARHHGVFLNKFKRSGKLGMSMVKVNS